MKALLSMAKMVAKGELGLHDDRKLLMPREPLIETLTQYTPRNVQDMLDNELLQPVERDDVGTDLFHAVNCIEFLRFLDQLESAGFPLGLQQAIAEMYHSLLWSLYTDIDYEVSAFKLENGREPSYLELAYLRILNEMAVAHAVKETEGEILSGRPRFSAKSLLQELKEKAARKKAAIRRPAAFGFEESQIDNVVKKIWRSPFQYFRQREIKAFIEIRSIRWTKEERKLLWGGHFDFALCDESANLRLAIEYHGGGHFGQGKEEKTEARRRDRTKKAICEKAGLPLIELGPEHVYLNRHKELFEAFLRVFTKHMREPETISKLLHDQLDSLLASVKNISATSRLANIKYRLDIYEMQGRGESILGLLWDLHEVTSPSSPLPAILAKLGC